MSVVVKLGQAAGLLMRWLGLAKVQTAPVALHAEIAVASAVDEVVEAGHPLAVPAVAGFVMRADFDRFFLAARLSSVATLNTPAGRKPFHARRQKADHPPVPTSRLGAKKVRINADRGRRIELPKRQSEHPSNVIQFPRIHTAVKPRLAKAA